MANTLTGIIPTLYEAMNVVSREMVGFIPAVNSDLNIAKRVAVGQPIRSPIGEAGELEDIVPGVNPQDSGDTEVTHTDIVITKSKASPVRWNGDEQLAVGSSGQYNVILRDQFADAMRKLTNAVEQDLAQEATIGASRAYGVAGTTPFASAGDLSDFAGVAEILDENGAPNSDRQLVLNTSAMANLRGKQSVLFKVNEAGTNDMLRNGMTDRVQNFALRYSGGIKKHIKGDGTGYLVNGDVAQGLKQIAIDTGSGVIKAGDIVTFTGDINRYVISLGATGNGLININDPALLQALTDNTAITIGDSYTPNFAFNRSALALATRAPAVPDGGDSADDATTVVDPISGLGFEVRLYRQYRQVKYEIGLAWGVKAVKPNHIVNLLG